MPLAALAARRDAWAALAAGAIVPNVFYAPAVALAAAPRYGRGVAAVAVQDTADRLVGLFPMRRSRTRWGVPLPLMIGWTHPFAPLGTPLVDPADPVGVIAAALGHVGRTGPGGPLLLPFCPADGPLAVALDAAIARCGGRQAIFGAHARAELRRPSGPDAPPAVLDPRAKERARQRRRLAERGALVFDLDRGREASAALDSFFALEAQGWKGRAGTAAQARPGERALMAEAVASLTGAPGGDALVARLLLDRRPVAAGVVLISGRTAWFWKTAYDETLAKYSPGVLLTLDLSAALLREPDIDVVDSCAVENHPMIDRLWPGRRALSDRLIGLSPGRGFALACRLETLRRKLITTARQARGFLRSR